MAETKIRRATTVAQRQTKAKSADGGEERPKNATRPAPQVKKAPRSQAKNAEASSVERAPAKNPDAVRAPEGAQVAGAYVSEDLSPGTLEPMNGPSVPLNGVGDTGGTQAYEPPVGLDMGGAGFLPNAFSPNEQPVPIGVTSFTGKDYQQVPAEILSNGELAVPTPGFAHPLFPVLDRVPIGKVNGQGQYALDIPHFHEPQQGSLFDSNGLAIDDRTYPLGRSLSEAQRMHAQQNSFQNIFPSDMRRDDHGNPLDGTGVTILTYDDGSSHQVSVQQVINDIAPRASTHLAVFGDSKENFFRSPKPSETFEEYQTAALAYGFDSATEELGKAVEKHDPDIVNFSGGTSRIILGQQMLEDALVYEFDDDDDNPLLRTLRNDQLSQDDRLKLAIEYVDTLMDSSPEVLKARQEWVDFTKDAALDKNAFLVFAAGNSGQDAARLNATRGEGFNIFAESPYVFSVAASHPNNTPDLSDDSIAASSSPGSGEFAPTVAAPGQSVLVSQGLTQVAQNGNGVTSGTSYSAPQVTGTLALMRQEDPNLSFEDAKAILTGTAVDTPAPFEKEGAGMLDPVAALDAVPSGGQSPELDLPFKQWTTLLGF
jgi:hypothetical protein